MDVAELARCRRWAPGDPRERIPLGGVRAHAPLTLHVTRGEVEHHDTSVARIRDEYFAASCIDGDVRNAPEAGADCANETAIARELEDLRILVADAADPCVAFRIDGDALILRRPAISLAGAAPVGDECAGSIELQH